MGKKLQRTRCCIWPHCRTTVVITYVEDSSSVKTLWSLLHTVIARELPFLFQQSVIHVIRNISQSISLNDRSFREPTHVVLGTHDLRRVDNENKRYIEKKYKHPSYVGVEHGYDIMLLKVSTYFQVTSHIFWSNNLLSAPYSSDCLLN